MEAECPVFTILVNMLKCVYPDLEAHGVCVCVYVGVRMWRVEVTPLRELCPLSCCIYIEISLFVRARPKA